MVICIVVAKRRRRMRKLATRRRQRVSKPVKRTNPTAILRKPQAATYWTLHKIYRRTYGPSVPPPAFLWHAFAMSQPVEEQEPMEENDTVEKQGTSGTSPVDEREHNEGKDRAERPQESTAKAQE